METESFNLWKGKSRERLAAQAIGLLPSPQGDVGRCGANQIILSQSIPQLPATLIPIKLVLIHSMSLDSLFSRVAS